MPAVPSGAACLVRYAKVMVSSDSYQIERLTRCLGHRAFEGRIVVAPEPLENVAVSRKGRIRVGLNGVPPATLATAFDWW